MDMIEAYKNFFKNYINFDGRTSRSDFWWVVLANILIGIILPFIGKIIPVLVSLINILISVYTLAIIIPGFAIGIRRLHDINKSGWFILLSLIPLVGTIIMIIFYVQPSVEENNKYGKIV